MPLWGWVIIFAALVKIPVAALMLWVPFRMDQAHVAPEMPDSSEEEGGSKAMPGGPLNPHPRSPRPPRPRRGPHGSPSPAPPPRTRTFAPRAQPHVQH